MTVASQIQTGSDTIVAFYKGIATYLNALGEQVDIATLDTTLVYDDILTYVQQSAQQGGSFAVGLSIEALSDFAAIQRELDISRMIKVDLMSSAAGEASEEAQIYSDTTVYQLGVISGTATTGSQA
jgi:hypothetical protein